MKSFIQLLLISFLLISCGNGTEDFLNSEIVDDILIEYGDNDEEDLPEFDPITVSEACDVFEVNENGLGERFKEMYPNLFNNCENIDENREEALFLASSFAKELFTQFQDSENPSLCNKLGKRAIRKYMTHKRREQKIANNHDKKDLLELRNKVTKERLDRTLRKISRHGCVSEEITSLVFDFDGLENIYSVGVNHIVNGSFELFKNPFDQIKGTSTLQDGWTIIESSNVPGWRVKEVNNENESINCAYLEIQTSGVVATAPDGNQIVELDSHCTRNTGSRTRGNANIEIFQKFPVTSTGTYSVRMKAQKRNGQYGNLEVALFQRKRDKNYVSQALSSTAQWNDVCSEIEVEDIQKYVTVSIRDNAQDRQTYGILLDGVEFIKGGCE